LVGIDKQNPQELLSGIILVDSDLMDSAELNFSNCPYNVISFRNSYLYSHEGREENKTKLLNYSMLPFKSFTN